MMTTILLVWGLVAVSTYGNINRYEWRQLTTTQNVGAGHKIAKNLKLEPEKYLCVTASTGENK
jgi:hypothetical protein